MSSRSTSASRVTLPAAEDPPPTLLEFLTLRFPKVPSETWIERFRRGLVLDRRHRPLEASTPYRVGLEVLYFREVDEEPPIPFEERILHRGERLLVADKPPFMPVVPGGPYVNECLLHRLRHRTGNDDLAPAHRLDLETAGVVLFVQRPEDRGAYSTLFQERQIERRYLAIAHAPAEPSRSRQRLESRLARGEPWFRMRTIPGTPNAITEVEVLDWQKGFALLRLRPLSGKKHQLRLQLADAGLPLVNDPSYPELRPAGPRDFDRPLQLLARELRFQDPLSGEPRYFRSARQLAWPLPTENAHA